jgi:hypothetical protein
MKKQVNLLETASKKGYEFQIHNQDTDESCVSHAFTAAHEVYRQKYLQTDDLLAGRYATQII